MHPIQPRDRCVLPITTVCHLHRIGLYRKPRHADKPVKWGGVTELASQSYASKDVVTRNNTQSTTKVVRLLTPELTKDLYAEPDALASLNAAMAPLGVRAEGDAGRVMS